MMMPYTASLLIEILTEELPPKALVKLANAFTQLVSEELAKLGFTENATPRTFATPRRIGLLLPDVLSQQKTHSIERRGPSVANAFNADGEPTQALLGFARSCGIDYKALQQGHDGKQAIFLYQTTQPGVSLESVLPGIVESTLKKLPAPKMMRWGNRDGQFVRPIHRIMMLHGKELIQGKVFGIDSTNITLGHRFLSTLNITISDANQYERILYDTGKVIVHFNMRRAEIEQALILAADTQNARLAYTPDLLDEVTALVEWPAIYLGQFDPAFLNVPQECLILSMQQHQRYFALLDQNDKLLPQFLLVSNIKTSNPSKIITGNERVLRARLSDAQFFYQQDQKETLAARVPKLEQVVYHNKLGNQLERVKRLQHIAQYIANTLGADPKMAARAAYLAKADLLTDMVGEFPELQGTMGMYYARHDHEDPIVAQAIASHYQPRFATDDLPHATIAQALALADKLESIVGIYGIGLVPTGDKDPFALRRAALGIARLLLTLPLNLFALLQCTRESFTQTTLAATVIEEVYHFICERLKNFLGQEYSNFHLDAVFSQTEGRFDHISDKLNALAPFLNLAAAPRLIGANKRINNILKKSTTALPKLDKDYLIEPAEKALFEHLQRLKPTINEMLAKHQYGDALEKLAVLDAPIDDFFNTVMVMAEDQIIRGNRLALLEELSLLMNQVADLSKLNDVQGEK